LPPVLHRQAEDPDTGGRVARFERRFGKKAAGTSNSK
jgi:ribosomal protein L31